MLVEISSNHVKHDPKTFFFSTGKKCISFSRAVTNSHNAVWGLASGGSSLVYPCCDRRGADILFRHARAV